MLAANLRRLFGTRFFIWTPTGYWVFGILGKDLQSYSVIKAFKVESRSSTRPTVSIGRYSYVDVERDELTQEQVQ